jgi:hypothetical protein
MDPRTVGCALVGSRLKHERHMVRDESEGAQKAEALVLARERPCADVCAAADSHCRPLSPKEKPARHEDHVILLTHRRDLAVFIFVMIGQRCPAGGFDGW